MAELLAARYPDGLAPGMRIELGGAAPGEGRRAGRFAVDLLASDGAIALHLNSRPDDDTAALNAFLGGSWGREVVVRGNPFPRAAGTPFTLRFDVGRRRVAVSVDGRRVAKFRHRVAPGEIREVRSTNYLWLLTPEPNGAGGRRGRAEPSLVVPSPAASGRTWTPEWIRAEEDPSPPDPLDSFRFFAVVCAWMEEDVIEATVRNAFRQGCERVYLVDNGSPDRTVERALAAGATLAGSFDEGFFDEREKVRRMQAVVDEVSPAEGADHVWWLYLDADEFYHGPGGRTLREYLETLDRRFRIVGARLFDHVPTGDPANVEARHPLDFQPSCCEISFPYCDLGHRKHHLRRWDRGGPPIEPELEQLLGFHTAAAGELLLEPARAAFAHHFPYRAEAATRARLERLFGRSDGGPTRIVGRGGEAHMRVRMKSLDALYRGRWADVSFFPPCPTGYLPDLKPWEAWVDKSDAAVARWY